MTTTVIVTNLIFKGFNLIFFIDGVGTLLIIITPENKIKDELKNN